MQEVTDPSIIEQVKGQLNITFKERDEIGPIICGTVVAGGYTRKLRMLRCDLFMMLAVCQSSAIVTKFEQARAIRRGILELIKRTQDISSAEESLPYFEGWQKQAFYDKCLRNECMETTVVNFPKRTIK